MTPLALAATAIVADAQRLAAGGAVSVLPYMLEVSARAATEETTSTGWRLASGAQGRVHYTRGPMLPRWVHRSAGG